MNKSDGRYEEVINPHVGQIAYAMWTNCGHNFIAEAEVEKVNEKSIIVVTTEPAEELLGGKPQGFTPVICGYPAGYTIKVPRTPRMTAGNGFYVKVDDKLIGEKIVAWLKDRGHNKMNPVPMGALIGVFEQYNLDLARMQAILEAQNANGKVDCYPAEQAQNDMVYYKTSVRKLTLPATFDMIDGKPVIVIQVPGDYGPGLFAAVIVENEKGNATFRQVE